MINIVAGRKNVFIARKTLPFKAVGFSSSVITRVTDIETGKSFDPRRTINGITGMVKGKGYYVNVLRDLSLPDYFAAPEDMPIIGDLYRKSVWSNLSDFQTETGFSVSNGAIVAAASNTEGKYLRLPNATSLDVYTMFIRAKLTGASTGTDAGLRIGWQSINPSLPTDSFYIGVLNDGGANQRKVYIKSFYDNLPYYSATAFSAFSVNHIFTITVDKTETDYNITARNESLNETITLTKPLTFANPSLDVPYTSGRFTIIPGASPYEIRDIAYYCKAPRPGRLFVGDSITTGFYAGSPADRFPSQCGGFICGGGGNKTQEVLLLVNEITTKIMPERVFMMIGTNDVGQSVSSSTWQGNMENFVNQIEAAGIQTVKVCPPPNNQFSMAPVKTFIQATWPDSNIDCYSPLIGTGTGIKSTYNSGDDIHPNKAGNDKMADVIQSNNLYTASIPLP